MTHAHSDHVTGAPAIHARWPTRDFSKHPVADARSAVAVDVAGGRRRRSRPMRADLTVGAHPGACAGSPDVLARRFAHAVCRRHAGAGKHRRHPGLARRQPGRVSALARAYAAAQSRARAAGARTGDRRSGGADSQYIEHRAQREEQVLGAHRRPADRPSTSITASIYPALIDALVPMARESVLAHLQKLESEGRARRDDARWVDCRVSTTIYLQPYMVRTVAIAGAAFLLVYAVALGRDGAARRCARRHRAADSAARVRGVYALAGAPEPRPGARVLEPERRARASCGPRPGAVDLSRSVRAAACRSISPTDPLFFVSSIPLAAALYGRPERDRPRWLFDIVLLDLRADRALRGVSLHLLRRHHRRHRRREDLYDSTSASC